MSNIRLAIGMATHGSIKTDTVASLISALPLCPQPVHLAFHSNCYVHQNREWLFEEALKNNSTHLMFIDTDMKFPADGIARLLAHDKPIIGANYNKRGLPLGRSTVMFFDEQGELELRPMPSDEIFECGALGTGFMLINLKQVAPLVPIPRFWFAMSRDGELIGEDVFFCCMAKKAGLSVWCDPTICVEHLGDYPY